MMKKVFDAISRENAIISINKLYEECEDWRALNDLQYGKNQGLSLAIDVIEDLPSVTQKPIECDDAISRQAVLNEFYDMENLYERIKQLPSVTQKSGKWLVDLQTATEDYYICSECGRKIHLLYPDTISNYPYCHCGARMEREEQTE